MSLRLETSVGTPLVRATLAATLAVVLTALLTAVVLAVLPSAAGAQTSAPAAAPTEDGGATSVVVRPGDSLWSIGERRLGPGATPQRIMKAAERIHALNRGRIGADPGLILVGQELLVPPALSEGPTKATPRARAAKGATGTTDKAPGANRRTAPGAPPEDEGAQALGTLTERGVERGVEQAAEPVSLPEQADAAPVPAARAVVPDGALVEGRRLLGLGVLTLTLLAAVLLAVKLPARRATRGDAERWGTPSGYHRGYRGETPEAYHAAVSSPPGRPPLPDSLEGAQASTRKPAAHKPVARLGAAATAGPRRGRAPKGRPAPRSGLALGAHNPEVRRAPLRARASLRTRRARHRRRGARPQARPGGRP